MADEPAGLPPQIEIAEVLRFPDALAQQFHYPFAPVEQREHSAELVTLRQPFTAQAEAFRAIRTRVLMRQPALPVEVKSGMILVQLQDSP